MTAPRSSQLSIVRRLRFCAGHRLPRHEGKCAFLHGHNYRVDIEVERIGGGVALDPVGRIVDFAVVKQRLLGWLDEHWDHGIILAADDATGISAVRAVSPTKYFVLPWSPTAENMARYLLEVVAPAVLGDLGVVARRITLWETDDACAVATAADPVAGDMAPGVAVVVDPRMED